MSREAIVYGSLLVVTLVAVYLSSIADKTVGERAEITVFSVALADITQGHYYAKEKDVSLMRSTTDDTRVVVEQVTRTQPKGNQHADKAAEVVERKSVFLANEDFATVFAGFTPLLAKRVLGKASEVDLTLFGLQDGKARLVLQLQDKAQGNIEFDVGKKSYGSSEYYVRYGEQVYLVAGRSIDRIVRARSLLFEDKLLAVAFTDGVTAELQADDKSMMAVLQGSLGELRHHGREHRHSEGKWLVAGKEQKQFGNWLRRLRGIEVMAYRRELPDTVKELMTLKFKQDDDELEHLRFWHWQTATRTDVFFVQSKFSGELYAELPAGRMQQLTHDIRKGDFMQAVK